MKCDRVRELISEYYEDTLDAALKEKISIHMDSCASCRYDLESIKKTYKYLESIPDIDPPVNFRANILAKAAEIQERKTVKRKLFGMTWLYKPVKLNTARDFIAVCAGLILAALIYAVPQYSNNFISGVFDSSLPAYNNNLKSEIPIIINIEDMNKSKWMKRKMLRNSVWTEVSVEKSDEKEILYNVSISKNSLALISPDVVDDIKISVYLVDSGMFNINAIRANKAEWQGTINDTSSISIPVVADKSEKTMDLLIHCTANNYEFAQYVFLPSLVMNKPEVPGTGIQDIYVKLQTLAANYHLPVIANADMHTNINDQFNKYETLSAELRGMLDSTKFEWLCADGSVYVDNASK